MRIVYTEYFQKSKVFLYPLLGLKKGLEYVPINTFICWDMLYESSDYKFICVYNNKKTIDFKNFELKYLKNHSFLEFYYNLGDKQIYIFDMKSYKHDYMMFVSGKYSKMSIGAKNKILQYFGDTNKVSEYVESFLNPSKYHEVYAESLNVDITLIIKVYEICSKPNIIKETLFKKIPEDLQLLKNKSIFLKQNH
jgi:hypothetical protein